MSFVLRPGRLALTLALLAAFAVPAAADNDGEAFDDDHDRAREAVEQGGVLPLAEILARTRDTLRGDIVGIEFEEEHGRYIYEFKVIVPSGELREIYVDASTGKVLGGGED